MMASKESVDGPVAADGNWDDNKSLAEPPRRSPAELPMPAEEDWTCDAE